ncbi:ATP-dependent helicase [Pseudorhodoferax sp. Leaf267]|uniref:ATP-dependent helicase n=1 Tax=Pseudorhodoferax sp. Leaf267 TaxID=1736316 RepID=UPI0006F45951|nr:ATP-dependent helicase [Pseudorhodoferax sp. Leaf267]KQP23291.1 ATP-dependent DNA helicase [Pseudorhodoferax sp. Leaf267]
MSPVFDHTPGLKTRSDPFADLNEAQREAVEHGTSNAPDARPLLVIAGAGSGKTNTLAHRVARLILDGADPHRMLLLTFSRRAASEMEQRVAGVLRRVLGIGSAHAPVALPWSGTFHSVGARLLREYAGRIGLEENFTIQDRGDSEDLMAIVRNDLGLSATKNRFPQKGTCVSIYSRVVNTQGSLGEVLQHTYPWCSQWEAEPRRLFAGYVQAKQEQNVLDYDDLLLFWSETMGDPELAADLGARFDHVLVDEYQDTNRLQAAIVLGLKPQGTGVTVVGDDAQSIYAFRGATVRNILDFPHQFGQPARTVALERNYRSTQPILSVSNAVIAQASERHAKTLWTDKPSQTLPQLVTVPDEASEARWVADRVLQHREAGLPLTSQAALFRASSHSAMLELELTRRGIPFVKFGGLKFLEASHVKDMLAVLRFAQNPRGRLAGFRTLQLMPGIGPVTATRVLDAMEQAADPMEAVMAFEPPTNAAAEWAGFVALYTALRRGASSWPAEVGLVKGWYLPHLERLHDDADARRADVDNLERMAGGYASRERFLSELTLDPPDATSDQAGPPGRDEDYMILSTIHSAKGQEWKAVFVLRAVDGCIPSDMATGNSAEIDEERRLLYVALTRARDHLHVMVPHRFYVTQQGAMGDRHVYAARTRFIPEAMVGQFECVQWPVATSAASPAAGRQAVVMQVRDRARSAWR